MAKKTYMTIIGIILKNWKIFVGMAAGFAIAWWIQGVRMERLEVEAEKLRIEIRDCIKANQTNQETIMSLKKEIIKSNTLCVSRLKVKDKVIDKLRSIDNLKQPGTNEVKYDKDNTDDPVLRELNGMFKSADSEN